MPPLRPLPPPERGALLAILLVVMMLGSLLGIVFAFAGYGVMGKLATVAADKSTKVLLVGVQQALLFSAGISVVKFASAFGMWSWKKWGVYGFAVTSILLVFISARTDPEHNYSYSSLIWIALLGVAVLPRWAQFVD